MASIANYEAGIYAHLFLPLDVMHGTWRVVYLLYTRLSFILLPAVAKDTSSIHVHLFVIIMLVF